MSSRNLLANRVCARELVRLFSRGWGLRRFVLHPDEMGAAMQAESVQVHDPTNAAEREPLVMAVPGEVLAPVHEESSAAPDGGPRRRLQRGKSDDGWHS